MTTWIATGAHYHHVKRITAGTHGNGVLKLELWGAKDSDSQFNMAEITLFTDDEALTDRLVAAINQPEGERA
jgi:D-lyxose ketol-isomerase